MLYTNASGIEKSKDVSKNEHAMFAASKKYSKELGYNYLFYSIENKVLGKRVVFSTDPEWRKYFIEFKMIDNCPLYAATLNINKQKRRAFLWNQVIPMNKAQKEVVNIRSEHGIANGISITEKIGNYQAMIGLGVEPKNFDFENLAKQQIGKFVMLFNNMNSLHVEKEL